MKFAVGSGGLGLLLAGLLALVGLLAYSHAQVADDSSKQQRRGIPRTFEEARETYEAHLSRPALYIRTRSAERMASFAEPEGLALLKRRYLETPDEPANHVRYTTATMCAEYFDDAAFVETWTEWLGEAQEPADAWLWLHGQRIRAAAHDGDDDDDAAAMAVAEAAVRDSPNVFLRAASLQGLARAAGREQTALAAVIAVLAAPPAEPLERAVMLEACAAALHTLREHHESAHFRTAARGLIAHLEREATPARTRLILARYLARIYDSTTVHTDATAWQATVATGEPAQPTPYAVKPTVRFAGLEGTGQRVVFVLDLSDSMTIPLTNGERYLLGDPNAAEAERLQGVPEPTEEEAQRRRDEAKELPWSEIESRFDWARAELIRAIQALPAEAAFAVVVFGDEAETLESTPSLRRATEEAKQAVAQELAAIEPGEREEPHWRHQMYGTLMGNTNVHGALKLALRLTEDSAVEDETHVATDGIRTGANTLFFVSDGAPSVDNFVVEDRREPEDRAGDGGQLDDQTYLKYPGPYVRRVHQVSYLTRDMQRMNLFRHVELNILGIGEYDLGLLETFTNEHGGDLRLVYEGYSRDPRRRR